MSKNTVLITSALYTNYGIYSPQERIAQTTATAESARLHIPDCTIILLDNSKVEVQGDESDEMNVLLDLVVYYIDNSDDADIQYFHNNVTNYDVGKNAMEVIGFLKSLQYVAQDDTLRGIFEESDRIFKLSGRYELTERFDITKHNNDDTADKYIFKQSQPSWCDQAVTGVDQLLQTRLWSFTPSLLDETIVLFQNILGNMLETFNKQQYIDVEHSMYKFIDRDKLVMVDVLGLKGNVAPNGMIILE